MKTGEMTAQTLFKFPETELFMLVDLYSGYFLEIAGCTVVTLGV